jgi:uracil-DNA glycosylase
MADPLTDGRGEPWEYDPGPPRNRSWPRLFAETPNYRGISEAMAARDKYRWHHGPMFYRGRLGDDQVRVLIVGQEGAQDESLSHRSFTGGTGGRMQFFLNHLGITESYLFLNTFVYPIFGQYNGLLPDLAQNPDSPIAQHRADVFEYVLARNDVSLVVAVGRAAKESISTWIRSHGGHAAPESLHEADAHVLGPNVRTLGVKHPGSARGSGAAAVVADFKRAIRKVAKWEADSPGWLPVDPGAVRLPANDYEYRAAPIPFRDFAFGTTWRLGRKATSSRRLDSQRSIQIYGGGGGSNSRVSYARWAASTAVDPGYSDGPGDLPYEPPKDDYREYDRGPGPSMARLLMGASPGFQWPDFETLGFDANPAFGRGVLYRGRLRRPSLYVLADQHSQDDLFTCRALSGNAGQHLQAFLRAAGVTTKYSIVRTLPIDTLEESVATVAAATTAPAVVALHAEIMRRSTPSVILALGIHAQQVAAAAAPAGMPVVDMARFDESDPSTAWAPAFAELIGLPFQTDIVATDSYAGSREQIPRADLPFGTLRWQGTTGDRAKQGKIGGKFTPNFYKLRMPEWVDNLDPAPLSASEQRAVAKLKDD